MNIVILESSPHKNGSSNLLAKQFSKGAKEKGHNIKVFDLAHMDISYCLGCGNCFSLDECTQKDDMFHIKKALLNCDLVIFVSPIYFYGISSRLKTCIDRLHHFYHQFYRKKMKSVLNVTQARPDIEGTYFARDFYLALCDYIGFQNIGMVLGNNCGNPKTTLFTEHMQEAYLLGKSVE